MTTVRRIFNLPAYESGPDMLSRQYAQLLVTFNTETGVMHAAVRGASWDTWGRPMEQIDAQDDAPGARSYGPEGRTYSQQPEDSSNI